MSSESLAPLRGALIRRASPTLRCKCAEGIRLGRHELGGTVEAGAVAGCLGSPHMSGLGVDDRVPVK